MLTLSQINATIRFRRDRNGIKRKDIRHKKLRPLFRTHDLRKILLTSVRQNPHLRR